MYKLLEKLGPAKSNRVYKAYDSEQQKVVALKFATGKNAEFSESVARLHLEAFIMAGCAHPNILECYSIGEQEGRHFLAMEFAEAGPLSLRLHERRHDRDIAETLALVSRGVARVHNLGYLHLAISADTIFLTGNGTIKLGGFGRARSMDMVEESWRSDLRALGTLLFQFIGYRATTDDVKNPSGNAALQRIWMRCVRDDPSETYSSVAELADDLARLAG